LETILEICRRDCKGRSRGRRVCSAGFRSSASTTTGLAKLARLAARAPWPCPGIARRSVDSIAQDPAYHDFADQRALLAFQLLNVASNLPFALVGLFGLAVRRGCAVRSCAPSTSPTAREPPRRLRLRLHHAAPSTPALAWDRLPMTVAFMALFALVLRDRLSNLAAARLAAHSLVPPSSPARPHRPLAATERTGRRRDRTLVQFPPMLLIRSCSCSTTEMPRRALALVQPRELFQWRRSSVYDRRIYEATELLSGHSSSTPLPRSLALVVLAALRPRRKSKRRRGLTSVRAHR
jgi:hypothetical protein